MEVQDHPIYNRLEKQLFTLNPKYPLRTETHVEYMTLKQSWHLRTKKNGGCHLYQQTYLPFSDVVWWHKPKAKRTRETRFQHPKPVLSKNNKIGELNSQGKPVLKEENLFLKSRTLSPPCIYNKNQSADLGFQFQSLPWFSRIRAEKLAQKISSIFPKQRLTGWCTPTDSSLSSVNRCRRSPSLTENPLWKGNKNRN